MHGMYIKMTCEVRMYISFSPLSQAGCAHSPPHPVRCQSQSIILEIHHRLQEIVLHVSKY